LTFGGEVRHRHSFGVGVAVTTGDEAVWRRGGGVRRGGPAAWQWRFPPLAALPHDRSRVRTVGFLTAQVNLVSRALDPTSSLYCAVRRGPTNLERLDTPDQGVGSRPSSAVGPGWRRSIPTLLSLKGFRVTRRGKQGPFRDLGTYPESRHQQQEQRPRPFISSGSVSVTPSLFR
jgi:hypothetical protein